jgi:hypothetical protein
MKRQNKGESQFNCSGTCFSILFICVCNYCPLIKVCPKYCNVFDEQGCKNEKYKAVKSYSPIRFWKYLLFTVQTVIVHAMQLMHSSAGCASH